jgi:hypothetical protein
MMICSGANTCGEKFGGCIGKEEHEHRSDCMTTPIFCRHAGHPVKCIPVVKFEHQIREEMFEI